ncbi:MAG: hypothetical protein E7Z90_06400 [Cyanobacteria bacterium SIG29]|nr:hypothetical protein [Cyanobacteria bacterium SIG29]
MVNKITTAITPLEQVEKINEIIDNIDNIGGAGLPIGSIIKLSCSSTYVPEGTLPCDGGEYTKAQFEQFYTNYLASGKLKTCTYTEYTSEINATGQCSKFALDTTNNKFKVPLIPNKQVFDINDSVPVIGNGMTLGLTINNQNAGLIQASVGDQYTVLEAVQSEYGKDLNNSGYTWDWVLINRANVGVTTDSDKSGIIADTSNSRKYLDFRYFVVVANGSINQSQMDWNQWASNLSSKADKSEVESLKARYVVAKSDKSILPSWWTVYSDGWIEQGGQAVITGATITFLKPFTTANYFATANDYGANGNAFTVSIKNKTTTTCKTYQADGNTTFKCDWYACGY